MILLRLLTWRYVRTHRLRTTLTLLGAVLGVTVVVAVQTANQTVLQAFSETIDRIAGKTELQITAGEAGFGEDVLDRVQALPFVRVAVPVIEAVVEPRLRAAGDLLVLGVDMTGDRSLRDYDLESGDEAIVEDPLLFLAQPDSLIVSNELAERNGFGVGAKVAMLTADGEKTFVVRGIMKPSGLATAFGGSLAVMDVYAAQHMFGRGRTFDRIDLALTPGTPLARAQDELAAELGPGFDVQPPATRGRQAGALIAGYTTMVSISSLFALLIGVFIIYNSFATAVAQRRTEIGILRALGATRGQIRTLFLGESLILGVLGALVGMGAGMLAAGGVAAAVGGLVGELYGVASQASTLALDPNVLMLTGGAGVLTSMVAAAIPAWQAARVDPVHAITRGAKGESSAGSSRVRLRVSAVVAVVAVGCVAASASQFLFYLAYVLAIVAALLAAPALTAALARALRPLLMRLFPVEGALAADSLLHSPRRSSGSVAALMLSLALTLAFAGMARAAYASVLTWVETSFNPDLFVMPSERLDLRTLRFPAAMGDDIAAVPGVDRVQRYRSTRISFRGRPAMLAAIEMESVRHTTRTTPVEGNADEMYGRAGAGEGVIVADNFAQLHGVEFGDTVELLAPYGTVRLPVVGIIIDYVDQQGTVFIDRALFVKYWRDETVNDFRVFAAAGTDVGDLRRRILERFAGRQRVFVFTSEDSRAYTLNVAGQWFSVINVQIAIAMLVAMFGIVNTMTVSITDRRRELGVLKAVGAFRRQIRRAVWLEAGSIALIGLLLAAGLGAINLYFLLALVRHDALGLRLDYMYPGGTLLALGPIMLAAAVLAALWPSEAAVRGSLVEALEYE